jgi:hypothetical protein
VIPIAAAQQNEVTWKKTKRSWYFSTMHNSNLQAGIQEHHTQRGTQNDAPTHTLHRTHNPSRTTYYPAYLPTYLGTFIPQTPKLDSKADFGV